MHNSLLTDKIIIICSGRNVARGIGDCIASAKEQIYYNFEFLLYIDASDDDSVQLAQKSINGDCRFKVFHGKNRVYAAKARWILLEKSSYARDSDIVVFLDADDRFYQADSLQKLVSYYQSSRLLATHGNFITHLGKACSWSQDYPEEVKQQNTFRSSPWRATHLRSFKYGLFKYIDEGVILDNSGKPFKTATDMAVFLPILELAGKFSQYISEVLYVYNESTDEYEKAKKKKAQLEAEAQIRKKQSYMPLSLSKAEYMFSKQTPPKKVIIMPKVSIVVPVYNVEKYLGQCLESLVGQTLPDIEIVAVNDGSTDGSLSVLQNYQAQYDVIKIIDKQNGGLSSARNAGLEAVTGEYVAFVDSDDWVDPDMYQKLYQKALRLNADIVFCGLSVYNEPNGKFSNNPYYDLSVFDDSFDDKAFHYQEVKNILFSIPVSACNKIYKRSVLQKADARFPIGFIFEDNPFFFKVFFAARKVALLRENLYFRRMERPNSIITSRDERYLDYIEIFKMVSDVLKSKAIFEEQKLGFFTSVINNLLKRLNMISKEHQEAFFRKTKAYFVELDLKSRDFESIPEHCKTKYLDMISSEDVLDFEKQYRGGNSS